MPRATVDTTPTEYDLKTLPEGKVSLKKMSYGAWLTRQEMMMEIQMSGSKGGETSGSMKMANRAVTEFELRNTIVAHNLEDEHGNPLDVNSPQFLDVLDPRVGGEISGYVSEMHEVDEGN